MSAKPAAPAAPVVTFIRTAEAEAIVGPREAPATMVAVTLDAPATEDRHRVTMAEETMDAVTVTMAEGTMDAIAGTMDEEETMDATMDVTIRRRGIMDVMSAIVMVRSVVFYRQIFLLLPCACPAFVS